MALGAGPTLFDLCRAVLFAVAELSMVVPTILSDSMGVISCMFVAGPGPSPSQIWVKVPLPVHSSCQFYQLISSDSGVGW